MKQILGLQCDLLNVEHLVVDLVHFAYELVNVVVCEFPLCGGKKFECLHRFSNPLLQSHKPNK